MAMPSGKTSEYRTWSAVNWEELRDIWARLLPEEGKPRRFREQPLSDQQAGWVFERLVMEAFRLDDVCGHYPYVVSEREEVDGLIVAGCQGFLIESKCKRKGIGIDPIYRLHILVGHRPAGTLGLFFSASGFTPGAFRSAEFLKPIQILLFDRMDLEWAFQAEDRMMAMIRSKWAFALKFGRPYYPIARRDKTGSLVSIPLEFFGTEWGHVHAPGPVTHGEPSGTTLPGGALP